MKRITLSLVSIFAVSGLAFAGGDIVPVVEDPVVVMEEKSPYYVGIGFGEASINNDFVSEEISSTTLMLQAGYTYNPYVALEGRYTFGLSTDYDSGTSSNSNNDYDGDFSSWGIYVKPMYPIGDLNIYALLGYGGLMLDDLENGDAYESGFQWGLGVDYAFTEQFSVFVDYVSLYDDTGFDYRSQNQDVDSDTWALGVSYKF